MQAREIISPAYSTIPVSFEVRAGEIVGIAGLVGAGRTELLQTIFGVTPALAGELELDGQSFRPSCPADAINAGIALAPEDRKQHGLVLPMTVRENASLPSLERDQSKGFLNHEAELKIADRAVEQMSIKTPTIEQIARFLSGGNQQKLVLAREIESKPEILLVGQPTRGVDIGAIERIYGELLDLRNQGTAILLVSVELDEIMSLSDRIIVMNQGRLVGEVIGSNANELEIGKLMSGLEEELIG